MKIICCFIIFVLYHASVFMCKICNGKCNCQKVELKPFICGNIKGGEQNDRI